MKNIEKMKGGNDKMENEKTIIIAITICLIGLVLLSGYTGFAIRENIEVKKSLERLEKPQYTYETKIFYLDNSNKFEEDVIYYLCDENVEVIY